MALYYSHQGNSAFSVNSNILNAEFVSKIDNILSAVSEIKLTIPRHESLFSEFNSKLDQVSSQLHDLGGRTSVLENTVVQIENRMSIIESSKSSLDESVISEVLDKQDLTI